jgi:transcriptional regulator with XRE-family HTH domain
MHNRGMGKIGNAARQVQEADSSSLAGRLRYAMMQRNTNPNKIELSTGIPRQTFYAVLRGQTQNFTYDVLARVSKYLGVRPEWLARGDMPINPAPQLKDDDEIQLVYDFRGMSPQHQRDLAEIARRWADEDGEHPSPSRPFYPRRPPKQ